MQQMSSHVSARKIAGPYGVYRAKNHTAGTCEKDKTLKAEDHRPTVRDLQDPRRTIRQR